MSVDLDVVVDVDVCAFPFGIVIRRVESNRLYARTQFSLAACEDEYFAEDAFARTPNHILARGNVEPLLGMPMFKEVAR